MTVTARVVGLASTLDADANRAAAVAAVRAAADDGVGLVVLPEYAARFDPRGVGPQHAEPLDGPFVTALVAAAREHDVVVLAGTTLPGEPAHPGEAQGADAAARAVNAVVAVGPDGVLGHYRKVHLYDAFGQRESDRLVAGPADAPPLVVTVGGLRVGILTCYDLRFPESARRLVDAGAQVIAVPAAWAAGELKADHWLTLLRARAIENTVYVLGAPMHGLGVTGAGLVVDPRGVVLAEGPAATATLDPEVVAQVRQANPSLENRRYAVVVR